MPKTRKPHRMHRRNLGPHFSEGARQMWLVLADRKWSPEDLGRAATWGRGRAIRYLYGDRSPDRKAAGQILAILQIAPALFDQPPSESFEPPAARDDESQSRLRARRRHSQPPARTGTGA